MGRVHRCMQEGARQGRQRYESAALVLLQVSRGVLQRPVCISISDLCLRDSHVVEDLETYPSMIVNLQYRQALAGAEVKLARLAGLVIHLYGVDLVHQWVDSNNITHAEVFRRPLSIELTKVVGSGRQWSVIVRVVQRAVTARF